MDVSVCLPQPGLWQGWDMHIRLEAGADHVEELAHERNPIQAVIELVWNSLDAEANEVRVGLVRNVADGVIGVTVQDDGHGISRDELSAAFRWVGNSWKRGAQTTKGPQARPLHGKRGQGRLRAFALGNSVRWTSVATDTTGKRYRSEVAATVPDRNDFTGPEPVETTEDTGTRFEATGRDSLNRLDSDAAREQITAALAPYLITYPDVSVAYDNRPISPAQEIENDTKESLVWTFEGKAHEAELRIIEWRGGKGRTLHLCDDKGVPVDDLPARPAADFRYAAYVLWSDMPHHAGEWMLAQMEQEPGVIAALLQTVNARLTAYFDERRDEQRRALVESWKKDETYPYRDVPDSEEQKVEQATFDVVATAIRRRLPKKMEQRRLMLGLLKETLQQHPAGVGDLLDQFVGLSMDEKNQLTRLLTRSSLSRLIAANTSVTNRLDFLAALRMMVFDEDASKVVKERKHLHTMLESELWVFGEQFNMMFSERGLTHALRQHLAMLGRDPKDAEKVRLTDGSTGRLDLMLSAKTKEHDRIRHLVVELKAPAVKATDKEASQIKKYARAVVADRQFADMNSEWDFVLLVTDYDDSVRKDINQDGRPPGILDQSRIDPNSPVNYRVWVKKWNEVLDEAERRLDFYQQNLKHDPTIDDVRQYLMEHHGDVIPQDLFPEDEAKAS